MRRAGAEEPPGLWGGRAGSSRGEGRESPLCLPQDSPPKLKDLAFLKGQLESLQRKVEDEVQAGVGQVMCGLGAGRPAAPSERDCWGEKLIPGEK